MVGIRIWGARGTIPLGGSPSEFGGNTSCISCTAENGDLLILDAGTGIYQLGRTLLSGESNGRTIFILLSHAHWDHIQGFPFFLPANDKHFEIHVCGGPPGGGTWEKVLYGQMQDPYCPIPLSALQAKVKFSPWPEATECRLGPFDVRRAPTIHPGGGFAYRIGCDGKTFVYATDTEHPQTGMDRNLLDLALESDLLIYDSTYLVDEYENRKGWGHSTWWHGTELAKHAGAKQLILFHHDPSHHDDLLNEMEKLAKKEFPNTSAAREGLVKLRFKPTIDHAVAH